MELLGHRDYVRALLALRRKPMRFNELQKTLGLNPTQIDRALGFLRKGLWVVPRTLPADKGPIRVEYALGKRGLAFLESFQAFCERVERRKAELGPAEVAELQGLAR